MATGTITTGQLNVGQVLGTPKIVDAHWVNWYYRDKTKFEYTADSPFSNSGTDYKVKQVSEFDNKRVVRFGARVLIRVQTENFPVSVTTLAIEVKEYDPFFDDTVDVIEAKRVKEGNLYTGIFEAEVMMKGDYYNKGGKEGESEFVFTIKSQFMFAGKEYEFDETCPRESGDYLIVKTMRWPFKKRLAKGDKFNRQTYKIKSGVKKQARFHHNRSNGRKHAACDLYAEVGTPLYAIDDGIVKHFGLYYLNTYNVIIDHFDFLAVYGEIQASKERISDISSNVYKDYKKGNSKLNFVNGIHWSSGAKIKKGEIIGYVGALKSNNGNALSGNNEYYPGQKGLKMLHFEIYSKDVLWDPASRVRKVGNYNYYNLMKNDFVNNIFGNNSNRNFQRREDLLNPLNFLECSLIF